MRIRIVFVEDTNMARGIYFLVKYRTVGFTAYATGINLFSIPEFSTLHIVRYAPGPITDLSRFLTIFQNAWRVRRSYHRWMSHPNQQLYCARQGRFPPVPPQFRHIGRRFR